ncbi:hypothetical protein EPUS_05956 [Endocarpon pusillum Z07020]|uniref:Ketoreductase (KR) domain-containing protein n=1 Tax=Endocarpon pusillum (strain Z07020 / HMAS-L-300199) TaxID=1263415 RepID=U1GCI3_ENDPU|nr:uncharacterized protein EPUS_05956 [Endocarpon pusillum Z07020]ERF69411.1 hypothetical protein EPUS_05956 [Endocarpon pusillum Z07020]
MVQSALWDFLKGQLFTRLPYPETPFTDQVVIVTGSNVGLGFEAAKHCTRLNAAKVILAVRSLDKGNAAKRAIEESTGRRGDVVEVWPLDLSSYASVKAFAQRAMQLPRLDVLLENAGIAGVPYRLAEDNESTITVNVISTFLLRPPAPPQAPRDGPAVQQHAAAAPSRHRQLGSALLHQAAGAVGPGRQDPRHAQRQSHRQHGRSVQRVQAARGPLHARTRRALSRPVPARQCPGKRRRDHQLPEPGPLPLGARAQFRLRRPLHQVPAGTLHRGGQPHPRPRRRRGRGDPWTVSERMQGRQGGAHGEQRHGKAGRPVTHEGLG